MPIHVSCSRVVSVQLTMSISAFKSAFNKEKPLVGVFDAMHTLSLLDGP